MRINFDYKIEYDSNTSCETQAMLCVNDFLLENTDNDSIVFYPTNTEDPGHADFHVGIEKRQNGKLSVKALKFECKSAKYHYYNDKKNKYCYDGSIMFSNNQIDPNPNKLFVLVLKTDKQIDSIKIGYFDVSKAIKKGIICKKGSDYRYRFNKEKAQLIKQNVLINPKNGNRMEMKVLATYNAKQIKELVEFFNYCNPKERKEYVNELSILELIQRDKAEYTELGYDDLKGMVNKDD